VSASANDLLYFAALMKSNVLRFLEEKSLSENENSITKSITPI